MIIIYDDNFRTYDMTLEFKSFTVLHKIISGPIFHRTFEERGIASTVFNSLKRSLQDEPFKRIFFFFFLESPRLPEIRLLNLLKLKYKE